MAGKEKGSWLTEFEGGRGLLEWNGFGGANYLLSEKCEKEEGWILYFLAQAKLAFRGELGGLCTVGMFVLAQVCNWITWKGRKVTIKNKVEMLGQASSRYIWRSEYWGSRKVHGKSEEPVSPGLPIWVFNTQLCFSWLLNAGQGWLLHNQTEHVCQLPSRRELLFRKFTWELLGHKHSVSQLVSPTFSCIILCIKLPLPYGLTPGCGCETYFSKKQLLDVIA